MHTLAKVKCLFRTLCFVLGLMAIPFVFDYANSKPVPTDIRCCVDEIARNPDGSIKRNSQVLRDFQHLYPCPSTQMRAGPCPGFSRNHTIPLSCYGKDIIENITWVPNSIKSCADDDCIDRWERKYFCNHEIIHLAK